MKKFLTVILAIVALIFILVLAKNIIIKTAVEKGVGLVTGLKLDIESLRVGIMKPVVDIKNIKLFNPASYPDKIMVDMPEIYVDYDLPAIIGGKIHLPQVNLAIKEFVVVKNAKGELNLDTLKNVQAQKGGKAPSKDAAGKMPDIKIDLLNLDIGKVVYKDYSKSSPPAVQEFNINLHDTYYNVENPTALASLIVVKALMHTSIAALTNFDLQGLENTVGGVLSGAKTIASTTVSAVGKTAEGAKDTVTKAADKLKGLFSQDSAVTE